MSATGTTTVHRCAECGHKSLDHLGPNGWGGSGAKPRLGYCSMGGCACNLSRPQVEAMNPDRITVPTWDEKDRGTGRWWS